MINYATADYIDFPKRPSKKIDYMNDEDAKLFYATALVYPDVRCKAAAVVPIVTVAGRAGHARTSTTTDTYSHFLKSSDRTAAEKIEELFD